MSPRSFEECRCLLSTKANTLIGDLFAADPQRGQKLAVKLQLGGGEFIHVDYSKNSISDDDWKRLFQLGQCRELRGAMTSMFTGQHVNRTEDRAALHMALRDQEDYFKFGVHQEIQAELHKMSRLSNMVRDGTWRGQTGKSIEHIVNIGIGGSDLGPCMATEALAHLASSVQVHFVSNVDGCHLERVLKRCSPDTTLFIVVSKTFTTRETIMNARSAKSWLHTCGIGEFNKHFIAVSSNLPAVKDFGIEEAVSFWDWVGGRYSLWSAVGLAIMISIGPDSFCQLLEGAHVVDRHFYESDLNRNIPVLLALVGVWHRNVMKYPTYAVIPYEQALSRLPAYLQQLDMESNGKSALISPPDGRATFETGPIVWGEPGTNGQHAFFQLVHQGTDIIPVDLMVGVKSICGESWATEHHEALFANCVAQSEALLVGRRSQNVHKDFSGNRPSNTIVYSKLTPLILGALIAIYEHKVFVQGAIWGINSFDQMGVELGKQLATAIEGELSSATIKEGHDSSTKELLSLFISSNEPH
jgi:glucose-6-phosphate isomerase